jgi:transposase-like protein
MEETSEIPRIIEQLRQKRWTMAAICRAIGVSDATLYRWYNGVLLPDHQGPVAMALRQLLEQPVPKRRYRRRARK